MPILSPDMLAVLAAQGIDIDHPGLAYAQRAYPDLSTMQPEDAYSQGFRDGAMAAAGMFRGLMGGVLDDSEMLARLYDPDVLPMPKVDGQG